MKSILMTTTVIAALLLPVSLPLNRLTSDACAGQLSPVEVALLDLSLEDLMKIEVVSSTRGVKSISQVPENMAVITAHDIELINAHTLADVLNTVTGVGHDFLTYPGGTLLASIQGSKYEHVRVTIDGVVLNNLYENWAYMGEIPVQNIERIEIVKGPASSAWGSSLGGVVNIITKSGENGKLGGAVSASYGERNTVDSRAELYGKTGVFSYYVMGGNLSTDSFGPKTHAQNNNTYAKLGYDAADRLRLLFTFGYNNSVGDDSKYIPSAYRQEYNDEALFLTMSADYRFDDNNQLNLSLREKRQNAFTTGRDLSTWADLATSVSHEKTDGAGAKFSSRQGMHTVVLGVDYDREYFEAIDITDQTYDSLRFTKWAAFANDTIAFNGLAVTPGIRYDELRNEKLLSPSLGITYKLGDHTILRVSGAEGFNEPALGSDITTSNYTANPDLKSEKIWSLQTGIETTSIKYLRLKATLFMNRIKNAIEFTDSQSEPGNFSYANKNRVKRDGVEIEAKTLPVYNTSLSAGACLVRARDLDTGEKLLGTAATTYDLGVQYDNKKNLAAGLKGRYVEWDMDRSVYGGQYSFVWDLALSRKIFSRDKMSADIFFTAHNIFNSSQYMFADWHNPRRWIEGGIRYKF